MASVISALFLEAHPLVHFPIDKLIGFGTGLQHSCIGIIESATRTAADMDSRLTGHFD